MELGNYKIKVTTDAESKEVISLLIQLGYKAGNIDRLGFVCTDNGLIYAESMVHWDSYEGKILTLPQLLDIVAQSKNKQCLISGADALRALADGKEVEFFYRDVWDSIGGMIVIDHFMSDKFKFRLKPQTITLSLEIPAPFEPKNNEIIWILNTERECGYKQSIHHVGVKHDLVWKSEHDIQQVVAALRGALKNG